MSGADSLPPLPDWVPPFEPRAPWWGGHLQTIAQKFLRPADLDRRFDAQEILLPLGDGDKLAATLYRANEPQSGDQNRRRPVIVLLHGLGGTSQSNYIQSTAEYLLEQGHRVLIIDFRGAGESADHTDELHHPGRSEDIARLLEAADERTRREMDEAGAVLVGFSLGGSVLLKFLTEKHVPSAATSIHEAVASGDNRERRGTAGILGAVTVSAPLDLAATSRCLARTSRWPYQKYLLRKMRRQALSGEVDLTSDERRCIRSAKSVWTFDETFTAPHCGFETVDNYYAANSSIGGLEEINVPTLLIYALDDPFTPAEQYRNTDWKSLPMLQPLIVPTGGHCGFQGKRLKGSWHDHCIDRFVRRLIDC